MTHFDQASGYEPLSKITLNSVHRYGQIKSHESMKKSPTLLSKSAPLFRFNDLINCSISLIENGSSN